MQLAAVSHKGFDSLRQSSFPSRLFICHCDFIWLQCYETPNCFLIKMLSIPSYCCYSINSFYVHLIQTVKVRNQRLYNSQRFSCSSCIESKSLSLSFSSRFLSKHVFLRITITGNMLIHASRVLNMLETWYNCVKHLSNMLKMLTTC